MTCREPPVTAGRDAPAGCVAVAVVTGAGVANTGVVAAGVAAVEMDGVGVGVRVSATRVATDLTGATGWAARGGGWDSSALSCGTCDVAGLLMTSCLLWPGPVRP